MLAAVIFCTAFFLVFPAKALADAGPKPSVQVGFTGMAEGDVFYGTLLSQNDSTGPYSAWDGTEEYAFCAPGDEGYEIWKKFVDYQDSDGYYFLQEWWRCSGEDGISWTYYPPYSFKILLYFPEEDLFCVSPVYERYAFDSYYTADLSNYWSGSLTAVKSYDYTWELVSLAARIVLTLLAELAAARLFGYRSRKALSFLVRVNVITQIGLNVALNIADFAGGYFLFVFLYVLLELAVTVAEMLLYIRFLPRYAENTKKGRAAAYAWTANILSFAVGMWLAAVIPGMF